MEKGSFIDGLWSRGDFSGVTWPAFSKISKIVICSYHCHFTPVSSRDELFENSTYVDASEYLERPCALGCGGDGRGGGGMNQPSLLILDQLHHAANIDAHDSPGISSKSSAGFTPEGMSAPGGRTK